VTFKHYSFINIFFYPINGIRKDICSRESGTTPKLHNSELGLIKGYRIFFQYEFTSNAQELNKLTMKGRDYRIYHTIISLSITINLANFNNAVNVIFLPATIKIFRNG